MNFLRQALTADDWDENQLIDVMRMVNATIYGFIAVEQAGLMTLERSADKSYDVMLDVLLAAIQYIRESSIEN